MIILNSSKKYIICSLIKMPTPEGYFYLEANCPSCLSYLYIYYPEENDFVLNPDCPFCGKIFHVVWDPDTHNYHIWL
jgi:phage FluMu protein Com